MNKYRIKYDIEVEAEDTREAEVKAHDEIMQYKAFPDITVLELSA